MVWRRVGWARGGYKERLVKKDMMQEREKRSKKGRKKLRQEKKCKPRLEGFLDSVPVNLLAEPERNTSLCLI